jgi:hypothetical protein
MLCAVTITLCCFITVTVSQVALSWLSHLCLHKPPLKLMGHRHSAALPCSPILLLPTAQTTPGVLPSDTRFTREPYHTITLNHAALTMQSAVSKWPKQLLHGAVWTPQQNQVVTRMPSNQRRTIALCVTQNSDFPAHILRFKWKLQRMGEGAQDKMPLFHIFS